MSGRLLIFNVVQKKAIQIIFTVFVILTLIGCGSSSKYYSNHSDSRTQPAIHEDQFGVDELNKMEAERVYDKLESLKFNKGSGELDSDHKERMNNDYIRYPSK